MSAVIVLLIASSVCGSIWAGMVLSKADSDYAKRRDGRNE